QCSSFAKYCLVKIWKISKTFYGRCVSPGATRMPPCASLSYMLCNALGQVNHSTWPLVRNRRPAEKSEWFYAPESHINFLETLQFFC
ncbi:MAG: hypothetical protein OSJ28_10645, partial [Desulfovibrio sp.]|nr:hypothetical protein [Desulfovibrio sp.]